LETSRIVWQESPPARGGRYRLPGGLDDSIVKVGRLGGRPTATGYRGPPRAGRAN